MKNPPWPEFDVTITYPDGPPEPITQEQQAATDRGVQIFWAAVIARAEDDAKALAAAQDEMQALCERHFVLPGLIAEAAITRLAKSLGVTIEATAPHFYIDALRNFPQVKWAHDETTRGKK